MENSLTTWKIMFDLALMVTLLFGIYIIEMFL